ncbi:MAG: ComEA family DNA-binding protein [Candidatus Limnocylindrales bacterium]|jgi:competence protein ComEA
MGTNAPWQALEAADPDDTKATPNRSRPSALLPMLAAAAAMLILSLAVAAFVELRPAGQVEVVSGPDGAAEPGATASLPTVVVQVAGAVIRPGVYSLPAGSRVADAIGAAGGYSADVDPRAAETKINLAAKLQDAQLVVVPRRSDVSSGSSETGASAAPSGSVNLNTATAAQLDELPGIGPATAAKIIASREQLPFASVDDLVTRKC